MKTFWQLCAELREPFVLVTLVAGRGHVPQEVGAKAIVTQSGLHSGTVGGGKVEAKAIRYAQERLARGTATPELLTWNLQRDVGMTCGGEMSLLFESHGVSPWRIAVFGAGHVSQALVSLLATLDCRVECADPRAEWVSRLPEAPRIGRHCLAEPQELVSRMDPSTFFICLSQGHAHDVPVLTEIAMRFPDAAYVGAVGSATKASIIRRDLRERGVNAEFIEKIRCPIGLPFGSNDPAEIAVSIAAQLLQVRDSLQARNSATSL